MQENEERELSEVNGQLAVWLKHESLAQAVTRLSQLYGVADDNHHQSDSLTKEGNK